jgi:hypothetical protein
MDVEGKDNFIIRNSLIDIRYSNQGKLIDAWILVTSLCYQSADTRNLTPDTLIYVNADIPVISLPITSVCIAAVPSRALMASRSQRWRIT